MQTPNAVRDAFRDDRDGNIISNNIFFVGNGNIVSNNILFVGNGNIISDNILLVGNGNIISDSLKAFYGSSTPCNSISDNIFFCQRWQYHRDIRDSFVTKSASKIALWDSFAEYSLFYRSLLQKRPVILFIGLFCKTQKLRQR